MVLVGVMRAFRLGVGVSLMMASRLAVEKVQAREQTNYNNDKPVINDPFHVRLLLSCESTR